MSRLPEITKKYITVKKEEVKYTCPVCLSAFDKDGNEVVCYEGIEYNEKACKCKYCIEAGRGDFETEITFTPPVYEKEVKIHLSLCTEKVIGYGGETAKGIVKTCFRPTVMMLSMNVSDDVIVHECVHVANFIMFKDKDFFSSLFSDDKKKRVIADESKAYIVGMLFVAVKGYINANR